MPRFGSNEADLPDGVWQLRPKANAYIWALQALYLVFRRGVDVIFCGHMNAAPFASFLSRISGKPLWIQAHGIEAWEDRGPLFRKALSAARLITAVSRHTRRRLLSWTDVNPERIRVLPNTFDPSFVEISADPALARQLGIDGKKVILTVGRLSSQEKYKGHDRVIQAVPKIREKHPDVAYVIVGTGDDQIRLEALARDVGVSDIVIFAGPVSDHVLKDYFALADVFAMPSTGEGFGIVFVEAAASGLPVIGGNRDGSVDSLADGAIGCLVDPENNDALVKSISIIIDRGKSSGPSKANRFRFRNFSAHLSNILDELTVRSNDE